MLLSYDQHPRAGEPFTIEVARFVSPARVRFHIGASLEADELCLADPSRVGLFVLGTWVGFRLRVSAEDGLGVQATLEFQILSNAAADTGV